jgi:hypothetical protein
MSPAIGTSIRCVHHSCTFPTSSSGRVYRSGDIWNLKQIVENNETKQNKTVTDSKEKVSEHRAWETLSLSSTTFAPILRALCFNFQLFSHTSPTFVYLSQCMRVCRCVCLFTSLYLPLQGNKKDELVLQVAKTHRIHGLEQIDPQARVLHYYFQ